MGVIRYADNVGSHYSLNKKNDLFGIGTMVAPAIAGIFDTVNTQATNQMNLQIMREQNQWNLEQWNRENEYNLPVNQMQRLQQAGLNPNLVYAKGADVKAAASPRAAGAKMEKSNIGNIISSMAANFLQLGQLGVAQQNADTARITAEANARLTNANAAHREAYNKVLQEWIDYETTERKFRSENAQYQYGRQKPLYEMDMRNAQILSDWGISPNDTSLFGNLVKLSYGDKLKEFLDSLKSVLKSDKMQSPPSFIKEMPSIDGIFLDLFGF